MYATLREELLSDRLLEGQPQAARDWLKEVGGDFLLPGQTAELPTYTAECDSQVGCDGNITSCTSRAAVRADCVYAREHCCLVLQRQRHSCVKLAEQ